MRRILLAEDEALVAMQVQRALSAAGHEVLQVSRLEDGQALLDARPIDLLIADLLLREGNGRDLIESAQARGIPWLATTGDTAEIARYEHQFARHVLAKPFSEAELLRRVEDLLRDRAA